MKTPEGKVRAIYCHWDGYIDHNGKILIGNYTDPAKIKALIDLGDLSILKPEVGDKHTFDRYSEEPELTAMFDNWTLAYHRDRDENWVDVAPQTFDHIGDWVQGFDMGVEFFYLWDGQDWLVHKHYDTDYNGFPVFEYVEVGILKEIVI
jgi:hypothetical protein